MGRSSKDDGYTGSPLVIFGCVNKTCKNTKTSRDNKTLKMRLCKDLIFLIEEITCQLIHLVTTLQFQGKFIYIAESSLSPAMESILTQDLYLNIIFRYFI